MNEKTENKTRFYYDVETYLTNLESLNVSLPILLKTLDATGQKATNLHKEFLEKKCEKRIEGATTYYSVTPEYYRRNRKLEKEARNLSIASEILKRNYIISLICQFDSYIGSLIKSIFILKPELLNSSEKQLTFLKLIEFSSIDDAREYIIEKEIEGVLRDNHTEHFKWLENKLGIPLRKDLDIWSTFIELTERRNLYVHNNGIISNQYIKICNENNVKFDTTPKIGDTLYIELEYFTKAFKCLFELGVKLSQVIWRKLLPDDLLTADASLLDISFELILNDQYELAKILLDFTFKYIKKFSSEDIKLRLLLNQAQTYKWLCDNEKCLRIIATNDWSACNDLFNLASLILKDDFANAIIIMEKLGKDLKFDKFWYRDWPIFKEFRKCEEFKTTFLKIYGVEYELIEKKINLS